MMHEHINYFTEQSWPTLMRSCEALADFFQETVCRDSRTPRYASKAEMLASFCRETAVWRRSNPSLTVGALMVSLKLRAFQSEPRPSGSDLARGDRVSRQKLANLLERCGLGRAQSIMVGDTLEDCRAAEEAGID